MELHLPVVEFKQMKIEVRLIEYKSDEWKRAVRLREEVLRKPLGQIFTQEELELESSHYQIAAFANQQLIGTAVLVPEEHAYKIQRVAVYQNNRSKGIGKKMMLFCENLAKEKNSQMVYCHARDTAVDFYFQNDYKKEGEYFPEDGIPHLKMVKYL